MPMSDMFYYDNRLSRRVLGYILLCSVILSLVSTTIQLYSDYNDSLERLEQRFNNIETSYIPSMATSLWDFNKSLMEQQIKGIADLPDISYVKVITDLGSSYEVGNEDTIVKELYRNYQINYGENEIGVLEVYANYEDIYQRLWQKAGVIIATETIKIFIVTFVIMLVAHWLVTRHIYRITDYAQQLATDNLDVSLTLDGRRKNKDELDILVDAINTMRLRIKQDIVKLEEAENALLSLNGELEVKVFDRTAKLQESNAQLQQSLDDLTLAKDQLVQSEKMASLGQLVAGVAHEVNTPLGICVTSITALKEKVDALKKAVDDQELTKSQLSDTLDLLTEYQQIIERSLNKSVELIRGFKSVAVEQHTDPEHKINLAQHVNDVVNTVKTMFKRKKYNIHIDLDKDFEFVTFPSAWNQILTNFLMNSHIHGFEGRDEGEISIKFSENNGYLTMLYQDNGHGIDAELKKTIFDPFVTTKRGQGGSGLGLNIVFNLVHSKLGGTITCPDVDSGCCFKVKVPVEFVEKAVFKESMA
ncbi:HAMP domain-containing protein [Thalassotalea euphylliae]|uniref:histidine kinase n=2 Tax=Thalassotalea euphylliae TaxID=1655234 RepID=A0A3E0U1B7_9GAMM|nr:HAMP domain-containing protein [Thalassotalea euphylliae]